jgi:hypothetical protein
MEETASRADAVAKIKPIKDRSGSIVRDCGLRDHRVQPEINITGDTR